MEKSQQIQFAQAFHQLHHSGKTLILPNAWDCMSAKIFEKENFPAVATSSASLSWAYGYPDGEVIPPYQMIEGIRNIARCLNIPLTADIEGGFFWDNLDAFQQFIGEVIDAGAIGFNLEDTRHGLQGMISIDTMVERIQLAKEVAEKREIPVYLNARVDTFTQEQWSTEQQIDEAVKRAKAYQQAGADGIFVPFIQDINIIRQLKPQIELPMNVMYTASLKVDELKKLGVERISIGSRPAMSLYGKLRRMTQQIHQTDDWKFLAEDIISYDEWNEWFSEEKS